MNNNGVNLDASMNVTGTWENPRTGERVYARDVMMEDNQILVTTSTGRAIPYNTFQHYVKVSDKNVVKEAKKPTKTSKPKTPNRVLLQGLDTQPTSSVIESGGEWVDPSIFDVTNERRVNGNQFTTSTQSISPTGTNTPFPGSDNSRVKINTNVLKALDNLTDDEKPNIDVSFVWKNDNVLEFIYKYLGATPEEVVDCLIYKFVDTSSILQAVTNSLKDRLGVEQDAQNNPVLSENVDN